MSFWHFRMNSWKKSVCSSAKMQPNATNSKKIMKTNSKDSSKNSNSKAKNYRIGWVSTKRKPSVMRTKSSSFRALPMTTNNKKTGWVNNYRHKISNTTSWESSAHTRRLPSRAWTPRRSKSSLYSSSSSCKPQKCGTSMNTIKEWQQSLKWR